MLFIVQHFHIITKWSLLVSACNDSITRHVSLHATVYTPSPIFSTHSVCTHNIILNHSKYIHTTLLVRLGFSMKGAIIHLSRGVASQTDNPPSKPRSLQTVLTLLWMATHDNRSSFRGHGPSARPHNTRWSKGKEGGPCFEVQGKYWTDTSSPVSVDNGST